MRAVSTNPLTAEKGRGFAVAESAAEIKSALGLVYRSYRGAELIQPNRYGLRVTPYHLLPTSDVLVARCGGEIAATMTLVRDGSLGLPMESMYGREVAERRARGVSLVEISCLADRRADPQRGFALLSRLMSFATQFGIHGGLEEALIAVHPRHAGFYERYLGFEVINDNERAYGSVCGSPAVALSLDLVRLQMSDTPAHRRLLGRTFSSHHFRRPSLSGELLSELSAIVGETYSNVEASAVATVGAGAD